MFFSKALLGAAITASSAYAYCGVGMDGHHKEKNYTCADNGKKICNAEQDTCYAGQVWNEEACMCFSVAQCKFQCPDGQKLDPRLPCKCADAESIDHMFTCDPTEVVVVTAEEGEVTCPFKLAEMAAVAEMAAEEKALAKKEETESAVAAIDLSFGKTKLNLNRPENFEFEAKVAPTPPMLSGNFQPTIFKPTIMEPVEESKPDPQEQIAVKPEAVKPEAVKPEAAEEAKKPAKFGFGARIKGGRRQQRSPLNAKKQQRGRYRRRGSFGQRKPKQVGKQVTTLAAGQERPTPAARQERPTPAARQERMALRKGRGQGRKANKALGKRRQAQGAPKQRNARSGRYARQSNGNRRQNARPNQRASRYQRQNRNRRSSRR